MIRGYCPACGRAYKVDDRYAGMTGRCKACGASITVPGTPDEGLNGLPPLSETTEEQPAARGKSPAPQPQQPPAPPQEEKPAEPSPEDHAHFEPSHGPTPISGSWLKSEQGTAEAPRAETQPPEAETLPSTKLVTDLEGGAERVPRPFLLSAAGVLVVLVALGFCAHMATGHWAHRMAGGVGLVLAVLGAVRIWGGHWDGLIPAVLSCLGAGASYLVPSEIEAARSVLLAGAALALFLLVLAAVRRSGRDYFAR